MSSASSLAGRLSRPELGAGFVLAGPGVRANVKLGEISMLDIAPTAAHLLGVDLAEAQGAPLPRLSPTRDDSQPSARFPASIVTRFQRKRHENVSGHVPG